MRDVNLAIVHTLIFFGAHIGQTEKLLPDLFSYKFSHARHMIDDCVVVIKLT